MYKPATRDKMLRASMLSVKEYAMLQGITPRAVQLQIKAGKSLKGVERVEVVGNCYILIMEASHGQTA
jgi:hypothetical protein